jgi:hypothetical protein
VTLARSSRRLGFLIALAATCALAPARAGAESLPNHHQVEALYVIDHSGMRPQREADLVVYSRPFEKILRSCRIGVDGLTMKSINLADQASAIGARHVTALMMLKSIAMRITWSERKGCGYIYNLAEARRENGEV